MTLKIGTSLQSILSGAPHQAAWGALLSNSFGTSGIRFRCKRDASSSSPDPWATGTEFLNIGMAGPLSVDSETGEITLGALAGTTVSSPADLSSGKSVFRIEANGYYIEGTFGLTGSGCDLILSAAAGVRTGYAIAGATFRAPSSLPINGNGVAIGAKATDVVLQNTTGSTITNQAVTFGQVFKRGALPSANTSLALVGDAELPTQMDVKATYSDGSIKHAILSTVVPSIAANTSKPFDIVRRTAAAAPTPAVPSDFPGLNAVVALVEGGVSYSASTADIFAGSYKTWLSGNVASEWSAGIAPKTAAGVAHPLIKIRFNVRAYKGQNKGRIDIAIENCTVTPGVSTPTRHVAYDLSISVGGTSVYTKQKVVHLPWTRYRKMFWWGGGEPAAHVRHNTAYVISTKAVPNYDPVLIGAINPAQETAYANALLASGDILQNGVALAYMPNTGGRSDIGIIPGWDVLYLLGMNEKMRKVSFSQCDLMGSWGAHYRDSTTDQPISPVDFPEPALPPSQGFAITNITAASPAVVTAAGHGYVSGMQVAVYDVVGTMAGALNFHTFTVGSTTANTFELVGANTGSLTYSGGGSVIFYNTNVYDTAHTPAVYVPYMLSGDQYHLEEMQFYASACTMVYEKSVMYGRQLRAQAWGLRELAHSAYLSPDNDRLKGHFTSVLTTNLSDYDAKFANNASAPSYGVIYGGSAWSDPDSTGIRVRTWQDDFFTQSVGHIVELGFKEARALFNYKAKYPVSRMAYCRMLSSTYSFNVRADGASAPFSTIQEVFAATYPADYPSVGNNILAQVFDSVAMGQQAGPTNNETIIADSMVGYPTSAIGYGANMQPALAFAATLAAPGAAAAWDRYAARSVKQADFSSSPQFAIVPRV